MILYQILELIPHIHCVTLSLNYENCFSGWLRLCLGEPFHAKPVGPDNSLFVLLHLRGSSTARWLSRCPVRSLEREHQTLVTLDRRCVSSTGSINHMCNHAETHAHTHTCACKNKHKHHSRTRVYLYVHI